MSNPNLQKYFENANEDSDSEIQPETEDLVKEAKTQFQNLIIKFFMNSEFDNSLLKKILLQTPKLILPNMENPLFLSDFLTSCLDHEQKMNI